MADQALKRLQGLPLSQARDRAEFTDCGLLIDSSQDKRVLAIEGHTRRVDVEVTPRPVLPSTQCPLPRIAQNTPEDSGIAR